MNKDGLHFGEIGFYDLLTCLCIPQCASIFSIEETGSNPQNKSPLFDDTVQHNTLQV